MSQRRLGTNLAVVQHFSAEVPWINACLVAQNFLLMQLSNGAVLDNVLATTRPDGYPDHLAPGTVAWSTFMRGLNGDFRHGPYRMTWDGDGVVEVSNSSGPWVGGPQRPGGYVHTFGPTASGELRIVTTNPSDPVRNLRIAHVDFDGLPGETLHPDWLRRHQPLRYSSVRTMDWQQTNAAPGYPTANLLQEWAQRRPANHFTMGSEWQNNDQRGALLGVAPERIAEMVRALQPQVLAVNIPTRASNDYVTQFATFLAEECPPDQEVDVEYSNETWNSQFDSFQHCIDQGVALNLEGENIWYQGYAYYALRSAQVHLLFRDAWAAVRGSAAGIRGVWGIQHAGSEHWAWARISATFLSNPVALVAPGDVLAPAPYFGYDAIAGQGLKWIQTAPFADWRDAILREEFGVGVSSPDRVLGGPRGTQWPWRNHGLAGWARHFAPAWQMLVRCYEGGQHLAFPDPSWSTIWGRVREFQASSEMGELYDHYLEGVDAISQVDWMHHFDSGTPWANGRYGCWSPWDRYDGGSGLLLAPKYQALLRLVQGGTYPLRGSVDVAPVVSGAATVSRLLEGSVTCTPAVSGTMANVLQGSVACTPDVSGQLANPIHLLQGIAIGVGDANATLTVTHALSGVVTCTPVMSLRLLVGEIEDVPFFRAVAYAPDQPDVIYREEGAEYPVEVPAPGRGLRPPDVRLTPVDQVLPVDPAIARAGTIPDVAPQFEELHIKSDAAAGRAGMLQDVGFVAIDESYPVDAPAPAAGSAEDVDVVIDDPELAVDGPAYAVAHSLPSVRVVATGALGDLSRAKRRRWISPRSEDEAPIRGGNDLWSGCAIGFDGQVATPFTASDAMVFLGFAITSHRGDHEVDSLATIRYAYQGRVILDVEGGASRGDVVYAVTDARFATFGASSSRIGAVMQVLRGRRCLVYVEGVPWRLVGGTRPIPDRGVLT